MMIFVLIIHVLYYTLVSSAQNITDYMVPKATIQALQPNGFRIYIPGDPTIKLLHLEANFYDSHKKFYKSIREFVVKETNGNFVYEDRETSLKIGDTVVYYIFVTSKQAVTKSTRQQLSVSGYSGQGQHKITKEDIKDDPDTPLYSKACKKTVTNVLYGKACSGQTIFEDNFDSLRENLWQIEQYIPKDEPYHPFVSYQHAIANPTVLVKDGLLIIEPRLQKNMYGELNLLDGCTGRICVHTNLLPPIVSGKVTAKFAFTYGIVEIRAKMPVGDWLYPELQLESFTNKYGNLDYASGVIKIASVFGNKEMNNSLYSNKFLDGSAVINARCPLRKIRKKIVKETWSDDFHVYSVKWTPGFGSLEICNTGFEPSTNSSSRGDYIELHVDGEMWNRLTAGRKGLRSWLPLNCRRSWYELLGKGGNMAPFDHHFYLTLGVAAGGAVFPDSFTGTGAKPWRNNDHKALIHFWKDLPNWYPTWTQPLLIDYVKVKAL